MSLGEEFKSVAVPTQELLRKLLSHALNDSGSVLTPALMTRAFAGHPDEAKAKDNVALLWAQYLEIIQERTAQLAARIDVLEQASFVAMQDAERQLEATRRAANRAADGRRVYETEDGRQIFDEQGQEVARADVDEENWNTGAPTWEDYQRDYTATEEARRYHERVMDQKERLEAEPDADDLDEIEAALDELEQDMPESVRAHYDPPATEAAAPRTSAAASYDSAALFTSAPGVDSIFAQAADPAASPSITPESPAPAPQPRTARSTPGARPRS